MASLKTDSANKSGPLISVVVPVYNGMPFIPATIESVRRQTYSRWELLICDNNSDDGTVPAIRRNLEEGPDERIRLICHEELLPMAENWNRSLGYAKGDFVKLLPSDDILLPDCLEIQQAILLREPAVGFVTSGREVIDAAGRRLFRRQPLREGIYDWHRLGPRSLRAVANNLGEPGAVLFRRALLKTCGLYDTQLRYFIDIELLWRFLRVSTVAVWREPLCQFRIHPGSASASSRRRAVEEYALILDRYAEELRLKERPWLRTYLMLKSQALVLLRSLIFRILPGSG